MSNNNYNNNTLSRTGEFGVGPGAHRRLCASAQSGHGLLCVPRGALGCHVVVLIRLCFFPIETSGNKVLTTQEDVDIF